MLRYKFKHLLADKGHKENRIITILEVATVTGINRMTLSKIANKPGANVTTDNLDALCRYFGCRIEELVEYVND